MQTIFTKKGINNGPTVAIFCGVHGDETVGIKTVDYLIENLQLTRGVVHLVYANPRAMTEGVRFTETNLNRQFIRNNSLNRSYEKERAEELMDLLDSCDALLDLHAYSEPLGKATPFVITENNALNIVKRFDVSKVLIGINNIEKGGSDGYMSSRGKIGVCVELGSKEAPEEFIDLGIKTAYQFMQSFELIDEEFPYDSIKQEYLVPVKVYKRRNDNFTFSKKFKTFEHIKKGASICKDGDEEVVATEDFVILFPRENNAIGVESFYLAIPHKTKSSIL